LLNKLDTTLQSDAWLLSKNKSSRGPPDPRWEIFARINNLAENPFNAAGVFQTNSDDWTRQTFYAPGAPFGFWGRRSTVPSGAPAASGHGHPGRARSPGQGLNPDEIGPWAGQSAGLIRPREIAACSAPGIAAGRERQVQMGKYPDNYCGILDSGDDLQAATAVWAALNVKGAESLR
jgi:hypothetical protein